MSTLLARLAAIKEEVLRTGGCQTANEDLKDGDKVDKDNDDDMDEDNNKKKYGKLVRPDVMVPCHETLKRATQLNCFVWAKIEDLECRFFPARIVDFSEAAACPG
jgi:hypothetical protein